MLIQEILSCNNDGEGNRTNPLLNFPLGSFADDPANLANAFTRGGLVKHLWNPYGSEGQPNGPAPPDGTDLIPSGTLEPTTASGQAEPVETKPPMGRHRLVPFRHYRGVLGD
jgi:hypothetical protein